MTDHDKTAKQKASDTDRPGQPRNLAGDFGTGADGTLATGRPGSGSSGPDAEVTTAESPRRPGEPLAPEDETFAGDYGTGAGGQLASSRPDTDTARAVEGAEGNEGAR